MTLRRFMRVTIDNFRQLIQSIAAPATDLPLPVLVAPQRANGAPSHAAQPHSAEPTRMQPDTIGSNPARADVAQQDAQAAQAPQTPGAGAPSLAGSTPAQDAAPAVAPAPPQMPGPAYPADETAQFAPADQADQAAFMSGVETTGEADNAAASVATSIDTSVTTASGPGSDGADEPDSAVDSADSFPDGLADGLADDPVAAEAAVFTLAAALESLLFVSDEAVEPAQLARALGLPPAEVEAGLLALDAAYRTGGRGLRLQTRNGRYQLVTAPEAANLIETFLNLDTSAKLSAPALETLAVAAYRQPVTRAQIEAVRGVDCSGVLRSLLQRGLLEEVGRLDAPGRPVLYGVTDLFMHHFGLTALHELPPLETAELARIEDAIEQQA